MDHSELIHEHVDAKYENSIATQLARQGLELDFEDIPDPVVHQAKRSLLDALGCALGAYGAPGMDACEQLLRYMGGEGDATVFGTGEQTNPANASLFNSFLVRYLDYNDLGGGGHASDGIPSLLAVAEQENSSGEELLTSLVTMYEMGTRFRESVRDEGGKGILANNGWTSDVRTGVIVPPAIGPLMGLDEFEIANAIGSCASRNLPLKILDAHREELTMTKNLRFGGVAFDAILSCVRAKHGFTGPIRIIEGDSGLSEVLVDGKMDFETLLDPSGWHILDTRYKKLCANGTSHGHIHATLSNVRSNDIEPADVDSVRIKVGQRTHRHTTSLMGRKYPRNAETANHSAHYATAVAIKEREFGPDSFKEEYYTDPVVLDLIERTTVEADPELSSYSYQGISIITTKRGDTYRTHVKSVPGIDEQLSDEELEEKFSEMALEYMDEAQIENIFEMVWNLEEYDDLKELTQLMVFE